MERVIYVCEFMEHGFGVLCLRVSEVSGVLDLCLGFVESEFRTPCLEDLQVSEVGLVSEFYGI